MSARPQVAAVAALMESVRGWEGSGAFNVQLFDEGLMALCCSGTSAEALGYFIGTFLGFADIR